MILMNLRMSKWKPTRKQVGQLTRIYNGDPILRLLKNGGMCMSRTGKFGRGKY